MPRDKRRRTVPCDQVTALGEAVGITLERVEVLALPVELKRRVLAFCQARGIKPAELLEFALGRWGR